MRRCKQIKERPQKTKLCGRCCFFDAVANGAVGTVGNIEMAIPRGGFRTQTGRRIPYSASLRSKFVLRSTTAFGRSKNDNLAPPAALRLADFHDQTSCQTEKPVAFATDFSVWQGQEDSNPRPTVLEWLCAFGIPRRSPLSRPFCSHFRQFKTADFLFDALLML